MKHPKLIPIALGLCALAFGSAHAQQISDSDEEEIVRLSPFSVEESADMGRYQAIQTTSGSRVRMDLMNSTQSVSVLTNEFMNDVGTGRLVDIVKYVAGIDANNHTNALDTMFVRGFFAQGATLDGFYNYNWINQEPVIIDRIEVVKGPNAIIAPQGLPGGVINNITKRPLFTNKGYVSYQVGRYDSNRAEFDANYVVRADKLAVRIVGAITDADDYGKDEFHQNITVMPMLTYRFSSTTDFTIQLQAYNASLMANNGLPVSPYAVGRSNVHLLEGLPRDFQVVGRNITRHQNGQNLRFFLTSQITDKLSMRLAGNWVEQSTRTNFLGPSSARLNGVELEVVKLNPITGEWGWDGVTRNDNPTYNLGGANEWPKRNVGNLQNDFLYEHTGSSWKSQTVAGWAINYASQHQRIKNYVADPTEYDFRNNYTPPPYTLDPNWRDNGSSRNRSNQVYIHEVISLFEDRLVLNGSLSQNRYFNDSKNNLNGDRLQDRAEVTLPSGGIVYKIVPDVSLYYGFTKQELPGGPGDPANGIPPYTVPSRQHEGGIRVRLFDGKLYATIAYFDILQENLWQQDYRNYITPRPVPPYPAVNSNRTSKGFEFEFTWAPSKNLSVIGSYTDFKNRDADNMRFSGASEKMAAIWGSYSFDTGPLRGLQVGLGAVYTGEAPNIVGFYTEPLPGFTPVRVQPLFWHPAYTMVEASASYRFNKHWHAQLVIKNLLDEDAIVGSFNRSISISTPINPKLSLRYDF